MKPMPAISADPLRDDCASEPIHIPGSIQPHGLLLTLSEPALVVLQASTNVNTELGLGAAPLSGQALGSLIGAHALAQVRLALADLDADEDELHQVTLNGNLFDALLHRHQGLLFLELERAVSPRHAAALHVARTLRRLQSAKSLDGLYQTCVTEIRALTGYDRVTLYRFEQEGHGKVIGESLSDGMQPYLGLCFPASDIPPQARELYRLNWIRVIPDAAYQPVPILPALRPDNGRPLDLSFAVLRSVSPVHCLYLKNMGVRSSMSISLLKDDQLWGLITCGHREPLRVPHELRTACSSIGQLLSMQITLLQEQEARRQQQEKTVMIDALADAMAGDTLDVMESLLPHAQTLLDLTGAHGLAILVEERLHCFGACPTEAEIRALYPWVQQQGKGVVSSHQLAVDFPAAAAYQAIASGLLAIRLPKPVNNAVMWFRPELKSTVNWSGQPIKHQDAGAGTSSPRLSFELWKQQVDGKALQWSASVLQAVESLRRHALELDLARQVQREHAAVRARDELVAVVSHDLRSPLTILLMQCGMMRKLVPADDTKANLRMATAIETMQNATSRMNTLLEDLIDISRIEAGRYQVALQSLEVNATLDQLGLMWHPLAAAKGINLTWRAQPGLRVQADPERLFQVFSNLLGNALKFTDLGGAIEVIAQAADDHVLFRVCDNGAGIGAAQLPYIFERYWTSREGNPTGSGLGLYISHGIIQAHGGTLWAESVAGQGSVFSFRLAAAP
ncbi:Bacteriophytochrome (light-regulated signal transduction histidine kinase) [Pseudomonas cedrina]|uniref:histidine kinase n=2 Tax=Pseudomonas cedrina TaxID=651740 RepID=A0A1V2JXY5_PSECE|nr:ATP-binding protein [Pseudomonas cedrina]ONH50249.1 histidine kinase [Pseudomonas cedrina subsp. cedrina]SDS27912.1 Bacteriophytochrome (light-regulated signal transduction histidine kinase) [Pseudomonas cedrina]